MKANRLLLAPAMLCALCVASMPAHADKGGRGHGQDRKEWSHKADKDGRDADTNINIYIGGDDRAAIRYYLAEDYRAHCPPGLAKKHKGCLPPGQAKKRYSLGAPLPAEVVWEPLPSRILTRLTPAPAGYQYVRVDKDVLLVAEASHKVIDAITLLSAVGQ